MTNITEDQTPQTPTERAEAYLREVERVYALPDSQRVAWAIGHQTESAEIIRDLLTEQEGYRDATRKRILLECKLLDAIRPLFLRTSSPGGFASLHNQWLEGTAPRLREAIEALEKSIVR